MIYSSGSCFKQVELGDSGDAQEEWLPLPPPGNSIFCCSFSNRDRSSGNKEDRAVMWDIFKEIIIVHQLGIEEEEGRGVVRSS